jgi:hypothetical protein
MLSNMKNLGATAEKPPAGRPRGRPADAALEAEVWRGIDRCVLEKRPWPTVRGLSKALAIAPNTVRKYRDSWWLNLPGRLGTETLAMQRIPTNLLHHFESLFLLMLDQARMQAGAAPADAAATRGGARAQLLSLRETELNEQLRARQQELAKMRTQLEETQQLAAQSLTTRETSVQLIQELFDGLSVVQQSMHKTVGQLVKATRAREIRSTKTRQKKSKSRRRAAPGARKARRAR